MEELPDLLFGKTVS